MDNIVIGKYLPNDTVIHNLDPRAKIIAMLIVMIAIFIPAGWVGYFIIGMIILDCIFLAEIKLSYVAKGMKPLLFMMIFLFIINVLVMREGEIVFSLFGLDVYDSAIYQTLYIVIRLVYMVAITTILTATTKPLDLTLGIEDLLSPFIKIGVPAHEIAMMISIALRFIPTLIEETQRIMKAQASRGVDMEEGKLKDKILSMVSLIVPLFISAFQRAEDLAYAMEARGYSPDRKRTRYKQLKMHIQDGFTLLLAFTTFAIVLMTYFYYAI